MAKINKELERIALIEVDKFLTSEKVLELKQRDYKSYKKLKREKENIDVSIMKKEIIRSYIANYKISELKAEAETRLQEDLTNFNNNLVE